MKKSTLFFLMCCGVLMFSQTGKVGVNTTSPTENLGVNGTVRVRELPANGTTNFIFTQSDGTSSATKNQTFNANRTVVVDANGVMGTVPGLPQVIATSAGISTLNCSTARVTPNTFTAGTAFTGQMFVPYTGGNGGNYGSGTPITVNGLTFTLQPGNLNYGAGELIYNVTGTPTFSSPTTVAVPISFAGVSCTANVGINTTIRNLQYAAKTVRLTDNSGTETVTNLGPFEIRLDSGQQSNTTTGNKQISFRFTDKNHSEVLVQADKRGTAGGTSGTYSGFQTPYFASTTQNTWNPLTNGNQQPNIHNYDPVFFHFFDLAEGNIYRVTIGAVRGVALTGSNSNPGIISIFIELLQGQPLQ